MTLCPGAYALYQFIVCSRLPVWHSDINSQTKQFTKRSDNLESLLISQINNAEVPARWLLFNEISVYSNSTRFKNVLHDVSWNQITEYAMLQLTNPFITFR